MKITQKTAKVLGLSTEDILILKTLEGRYMTISALSNETSIPRTSLYYMLPKLAERNFLKKNKLNKKELWSKKTNKKILNDYLEIAQEISGTKISTPIDSSIKIFNGIKEINYIFNELSKLHKQERFWGIQPEKSILEVIKKNHPDILIKLNNKIREKKIIVEGIVHERSITSIKKMLGERAKDYLKSLGDRPSDIAKLPDDYLKETNSEIYLYQNKVAIVNWEKEFAVLIDNEDIFELVKSMFDSTKYLLEKYNQNEKIARILIDSNLNKS